MVFFQANIELSKNLSSNRQQSPILASASSTSLSSVWSLAST